MQNGQVSVFLTFSDFDVSYGVWLVHFDCWRQRRKLKQPLYLYFCMLYPITSGRFLFAFLAHFKTLFLQTNTKNHLYECDYKQTQKRSKLNTIFAGWSKCNSSKRTASFYFVGQAKLKSVSWLNPLSALYSQFIKNTQYTSTSQDITKIRISNMQKL